MKTAIKNIPKKIYLNLGFDKDELIEDIDFEELWQSGEITWCRDKINDTDIEYYASQQQPSREKIIEVLEDSGELLNLFASKLGCQTEDAPLKSDAEDYGSLDLLRRIREVISELSEEQGEEYDCDTCRHYPCIYQTKITGNGKLKKGNCGDYDDEQPRPEQDEIKEISCAFFRFWWNADGNNTEQGFDYWWKENKNKYISTPSEPKPTDEELLKFAVYIYDSLNRSYNLKGMKVFVEEYLNPS